MFRSTLVLSLLFAALGAWGCRERQVVQPPPSQPPALAASAPVTVPVEVAPAEEPPVDLHRRWEITVKAGPVARDDVVVSTSFPGTPAVKSVQLRESSGARVPSQMQGDGQLAFRIKAMKAGAQATYVVQEGGAAAAPGKGGGLAVQAADGLNLTIDGKRVLTYRTQREPSQSDIAPEYWRSGYLHPLYSPAGVVLTDDYPKDKPFEHGIWSGWQKVAAGDSRPDFWDSGRKKGRSTSESVAPVWGGPLRVGFGAHQFFTDMDRQPGVTVLREGWAVTAVRGRGRAPCFVVDLESKQESMKGTVVLQENPFGGITIRGNRDWQGADKSVFLTSEGKDRTHAQGQAAHWCYLGGTSGGKMAGVAILAHPQNAGATEAVFIDPQDPVMGFAPTQNRSLETRPGRPFVLKYRFVALDGQPDSKLFDRLWSDFANPPQIEIRLLASK